MDYELKQILKYKEQASEDAKFKVFYGSCETDNEPDYELLRKHIEIWAQRHPREMADLLVRKKEVIAAQGVSTKVTKKGQTIYPLMEMPVGLNNILSILSPNCLGAKEITPKSRTKRIHKFLKKFPVFQMRRKL